MYSKRCFHISLHTPPFIFFVNSDDSSIEIKPKRILYSRSSSEGIVSFACYNEHAGIYPFCSFDISAVKGSIVSTKWYIFYCFNIFFYPPPPPSQPLLQHTFISLQKSVQFQFVLLFFHSPCFANVHYLTLHDLPSSLSKRERRPLSLPQYTKATLPKLYVASTPCNCILFCLQLVLLATGPGGRATRAIHIILTASKFLAFLPVCFCWKNSFSFQQNCHIRRERERKTTTATTTKTIVLGGKGICVRKRAACETMFRIESTSVRDVDGFQFTLLFPLGRVVGFYI